MTRVGRVGVDTHGALSDEIWDGGQEDVASPHRSSDKRFVCVRTSSNPCGCFYNV